MIIFISGQPGNGKTLRAMALMLEEYERNQQAVKEGKEQPRRFFSNVKGATLAENPNAFPWVELLEPSADWTALPDGSFVVYDEAHSDGRTPGLERYGVLFPSTGRPGESDDPRIRALSTHRHRGFDLVMLSQWPSKIHHNVRQLAGKHIHMNRAMGLQRAGTVTWSRVQPDPYDEQQREKAEEEIWVYPQDLYPRFISSSLHTATYKFRVPKKVWGAVAQAVMIIVCGWLLWEFIFKPDSKSEPAPGEGEAAIAQTPAGVGGPPPSGGRGGSRSGLSPVQFAEQFIPRFPSMPKTAPAYDDRPVVAEPRVFCMASSPGRDANGEWQDASVTCLTEQGTRYDLDTVTARHVARYGQPYDPFLRPVEARQAPGGVGGIPPTAMPGTGVPSSVATISAPQISGYGGFAAGSGDSAP